MENTVENQNSSSKSAEFIKEVGHLAIYGAFAGAKHGAIASVALSATGAGAILTTATAGSVLATAAACAFGGAIMIIPVILLAGFLRDKLSIDSKFGLCVLAFSMKPVFVAGTVAIGAGLLGLAIYPAIGAALVASLTLLLLSTLATAILCKGDRKTSQNNDILKMTM